MSTIRDKLLPRLQEFSNMINKLLKDNDDVKKSIRAFDSTICDKANKTEITVMKNVLEARFIHNDKWKTLLVEFEEMDERLIEEKHTMQDTFDKLETTQNDMIA